MASVMDITTLDNFASQMPPWDSSLSNHLYGLVDIGSNGIRFSISDLSPPRTRLLRCLYRERAAISLFDALNKSPPSGPLAFPSDVITQVSKTVSRFKSIADAYGVPKENMSVFATEAMRRAENAAVMLEAIFQTSGLGVRILSPEVETLFGSMGARSGFTVVNGLFLDLGGGSVQMTYLDSSMDGYEIKAAQTGKSLPFGAAKLINVLERGEVGARDTAVSTLQEGMRTAFAKLQQQFPSLRETQTDPRSSGIDLYLCGGGFRGYGSMLMHADPTQPYPIPAVGAYTVRGSFFGRTKDMRKVNTEYEGKVFGMSKRRRQQFPAIATVVEALIGAVPRIRSATFCSGGSREGALFMKLPEYLREGHPLPLLCRPSNDIKVKAFQSVMTTVQSALPTNFDFSDIPTVFNLGLGPLFVSSIWTRIGEPSDANAAFELHQAIIRDPGAPGLTHLARAVLGLSLAFRWGADFGPIDRPLHLNLQKIVSQSNPEANFWAEYIGVVASLLATLCPAEPDKAEGLKQVVKFDSSLKNGKARQKLQLTLSLCPSIYQCLDTQDLVSHFKKLGKLTESADTTERQVELVVQEMDS